MTCPDPSRASPDADFDALLAQIPSERLKPDKPSIAYSFSLLAVAFVMVLLPLIYIGLVGALGYGLYWHSTENLSFFQNDWAPKAQSLAYVTPLIIGGCILLFMLKPLIAGRRQKEKEVALSEESYPRLWAFVRKICAVSGSPVPAVIYADSEVNASAGFRRGWLSFFSSDLRLTVGLPLVYGLDLRSLGSVLAHEFGHFSQGAGMRLTFVIRSVNGWFSRVVHGRDAWDERIERWSKGGHLYSMAILWIARGGIWISRKTLWLLMMFGHAISCFASRQMEYDADAYAARFAGSEMQKPMMKQIFLLSMGQNASTHQLELAWQEKRLPANLSGFFVTQSQHFTPAQREEMIAETEGEKQSWFATHPTSTARIQAAERLGHPGVFQASAPATILFPDLEPLARDVSLAHYHNLGIQPTADQLTEAEAFQPTTFSDQDPNAGFNNDLAKHFNILLPFSIEPPTESAVWEPERYRELRETFLQKAKANAEEIETFDNAWSKRMKLRQAEAVLDAGEIIKPEEFNLSRGDRTSVLELRALLEKQTGQLKEKLAPVREAAGELVAYALTCPVGEADPEDVERRDRSISHINVFAEANEDFTTMLELRAGAAVVIESIERRITKAHQRAVVSWSERLEDATLPVIEPFKPLAHPMPRANPNLKMEEFLRPDPMPGVEDHFMIYIRANLVLERLPETYFQSLATVVRAAEQAIASEEASSETKPPAPVGTA